MSLCALTDGKAAVFVDRVLEVWPSKARQIGINDCLKVAAQEGLCRSFSWDVFALLLG